MCCGIFLGKLAVSQYSRLSILPVNFHQADSILHSVLDVSFKIFLEPGTIMPGTVHT